MLANKCNSLLLGITILFVTLPSSKSKVLWFDYRPAKDRFSLNDHTRPVIDKEKSAPFYDVFKMIMERRREKLYDEKNLKNKCDRLFGSIYGTKQQRALCLNKLKRKRAQDRPENLTDIKDLYGGKHPFIDLTRAVDFVTERHRQTHTPFSSDYIDVNDLRTKEDFGLRKSLWNTDKSHYQRTLYSSDSESDSEGEIKKIKLKHIRSPKRFQVVANGKNDKNSDDSDDSSKSLASDEYKKPKTKRLPKVVYSSESSASSDDFKTKELSIESEEVKKPVKKKKIQTSNRKKEYYLQGKRLVDPDYEYRRRLPHFMPKRFHWDEDDLPNLGYYWFNGPQGRYPYFPSRP